MCVKCLFNLLKLDNVTVSLTGDGHSPASYYTQLFKCHLVFVLFGQLQNLNLSTVLPWPLLPSSMFFCSISLKASGMNAKLMRGRIQLPG